MFWLLSVMALDMVDEAIVNAKMVHVLPIYSSIVTKISGLGVHQSNGCLSIR